jgi:NAD+ kinase
MPKPSNRYQRVGIVYNLEKERAYTEYLRLKRWLARQGITSLGAPRVSRAMMKAQLVVALGGDGTVLEVARAVAPWSIPVLGVNLGRLGFLAATEIQAMFRTMSRVLAGEGRLESRTMVAVTGRMGKKKLRRQLALNDCVLRSGATGRVLTLHASVRQRTLANYAGDGLIISTPTGSTAYNLAASGPIVYPDLDALILAPICPHSLAQRPLVLPTSEIISIEVGRPSPAALLCIDGTVVEKLSAGDRIEIRRAPEQALLMMDPTRNYYQVLQSKLKWGGA